MRGYWFASSIALLLLLTGIAMPQNAAEPEVGLIRGTIMDMEHRGAPIPNATIRYSNPKGIRGEATSDENGEYQIPDLPPGQYAISVTAEGYTPRQGLTTRVMAGRESIFDVPMRPKPGWIGQWVQNRVALVIFGFVFGLVLGLLIGMALWRG